MRTWLRARPLLAGWLLGAASVIGAIAAIGLLFLTGIAYDISADRPHPRLVAEAIHITMIHSVARRAKHDTVAPLPRDRTALLAGAALYEKYCVACHGGPGAARAPWVAAMLPTPPYLLDARGRWSHAELRRLVRNGVKMTAMPAWGEVMSERQIAEVVSFVELMPDLTPEAYAGVRRAIGGTGPPTLHGTAPAVAIE